MAKLIDLTNKEFGYLKVLSRADNDKGGAACWWCLCACGKKTIVKGTALRNETTKSCGCKRWEGGVGTQFHRKHGLHNTKEYNIYHRMKQRCLNPNDPDFDRYGGRGISICASWIDSFEAFYADMGAAPKGATLERVDNEKEYSFDNCKWATRKEQARNRRNNRLVELFGETKCISEWCEDSRTAKITVSAVFLRIDRYGWEPRAALLYPPAKRKDNALV